MSRGALDDTFSNDVYSHFAKTKGIIKRAYNLKAIKIEPTGGQLGNNSSSSVPGVSSIKSIADLFVFVKTYDKDFSPKPAKPLLLNENKQPKVFYHGTNKIFDEFKVGQSGGIYLADNRKVSEAFTKNGNVMEVYPSMRNPLIVDALVESEFLGINSYKQSFYYEIPTPQIMKDNGYKSQTLSTEETSALNAKKQVWLPFRVCDKTNKARLSLPTLNTV